ncbi:type I-E CRISPR-associated protein Cas6/Cse3/CasE [Parasphaerochaeta coccoides]|uniref:CRISPR-associated protein, Cse3 family n=1 Tax=Parasphaerochaeta coccoides (strain ATCC BAA-1237 / DSM 17374 / SPN1) TaxID=760011 RepID=F4GL09_PARC1|nr:type I-E CRISPR-associated protein Cas6/Cse3/CasE [Parasphaerochaeta coccoides]AEC02349.1 CRISPR-associated protein, Cse3 family [Parasphaerochaeta coccoides DSM 17374]
MIASTIFLDKKDIIALKLYDAYASHKFVYSLFPGNCRSFLFLEKTLSYQGRKMYLVLSEDSPAVPMKGEITSRHIPSGYFDFPAYTFEVKVNPVTKQVGKSNPIAVTGLEAIRTWFLNHQKTWGFSARQETMEISDMGVQAFLKNGQTITHNQATVRGIMDITDHVLFHKAFKNGLGRGKAFGFGLLQIKPLTQKESK